MHSSLNCFLNHKLHATKCQNFELRKIKKNELEDDGRLSSVISQKNGIIIIHAVKN